MQASLDCLFAPEFKMPDEFKAGPGDVAKLVCRQAPKFNPPICHFVPIFHSQQELSRKSGLLGLWVIDRSVCRVRASPDADVFWAKKGADGKVVKIDKKADKDKKWQR